MFLGVGTVASAFFSALDSTSRINLDSRNASKYAMLADNLEFMRDTKLEGIRREALEGGRSEVEEFCREINRLIFAEHDEWRSLRKEFEGFMAPQLLINPSV